MREIDPKRIRVDIEILCAVCIHVTAQEEVVVQVVLILPMRRGLT